MLDRPSDGGEERPAAAFAGREQELPTLSRRPISMKADIAVNDRCTVWQHQMSAYTGQSRITKSVGSGDRVA